MGKSLHVKVLSLIVVLLIVFISITSFINYQYEVKKHIDSKIESIEVLSHLIQRTIYEDMLAGRADLARNIIESINQSTTDSENEQQFFIQIIRNNGVERAFYDLKTIDSVTSRVSNLSATTKIQWLENHRQEENNIAPKTDTVEFKKTYAQFSKNWNSPSTHYIDKKTEELIYLQAIEEKEACLTCHIANGGRGLIMITTTMASDRQDMFNLAMTYTASGILLTIILTFATSIVIRKSITGPLSDTVELMDKISQDENQKNIRLEVKSEDEIGILAKRFNSMLDSIESRENTLKTLFKSIEASQQEWRTIFDSIQELISVYDFQGKLIKCNLSFALRLNKKFENLIGISCESLLMNSTENKDGFDKILFNWSNPKIVRDELHFKNLKGTFSATRIPNFDNRGNVVATILVLRDVSEEKELKKQLLQSEKMKSIGQLVAGIAHELNNPLMGITGYSEILMDTDPEVTVGEIKPKIDKIYQEALRTAKIVQQLLIFARAKEVQRTPHNVNDVIKDTIELREFAATEVGVTIKSNLSPHIGNSFIDYYQLQQVFTNIINNSIDAIKEHADKGTIEITSKLSGRTIYIKFKDSGSGIPTEVMEKVFDPFFSTKEVGKGTGLGLSISHGIIKDHGGWIDIKSRDGEGITVTVELPIDIPATGSKIESKIPVQLPSEKNHKEELVLVVDDEPNIREFVAHAIAKEGFKVDMARNGYEALELIENKKYSIVITDIKMPGLGGHEIYNAIKEKHKYLTDRVILLTGDVFSEDIKSFIEESGCPHLLKPFELKALIELVNKLTD